jgi:hypothetical protein
MNNGICQYRFRCLIRFIRERRVRLGISSYEDKCNYLSTRSNYIPSREGSVGFYLISTLTSVKVLDRLWPSASGAEHGRVYPMPPS